MMKWVSIYIRTSLKIIYCAFYVIFEGIFKTSNSWPVIISVTGAQALILSFPITCFIQWFALYIGIINLNSNIYLLIGIGLFICIDWLLNKYYNPISKPIEKKIKKEKLHIKIMYMIIAILLMFSSFMISSYFNKKYTSLWCISRYNGIL